MVGWGQAGYLSEITAAGQLLFNAHLPPDWESYRTFVLPWSGQPAEPPALAVVPAAARSRGATVYASWNGATRSRVLAGARRVLAGGADAGSGGAAPKTGFETALRRPRAP